MRYPFESEAAQKLNKQIFETIYFGALDVTIIIWIEKSRLLDGIVA